MTIAADLSGVNGPLGEIENHLASVQHHIDAAVIESSLPEWRRDQIAEHIREISEYAKLALQAAEDIEADIDEGDEEED